MIGIYGCHIRGRHAVGFLLNATLPAANARQANVGGSFLSESTDLPAAWMSGPGLHTGFPFAAAMSVLALTMRIRNIFARVALAFKAVLLTFIGPPRRIGVVYGGLPGLVFLHHRNPRGMNKGLNHRNAVPLHEDVAPTFILTEGRSDFHTVVTYVATNRSDLMLSNRIREAELANPRAGAFDSCRN